MILDGGYYFQGIFYSGCMVALLLWWNGAWWLWSRAYGDPVTGPSQAPLCLAFALEVGCGGVAMVTSAQGVASPLWLGTNPPITSIGDLFLMWLNVI